MDLEENDDEGLQMQETIIKSSIGENVRGNLLRHSLSFRSNRLKVQVSG